MKVNYCVFTAIAQLETLMPYWVSSIFYGSNIFVGYHILTVAYVLCVSPFIQGIFDEQ